MLTTFSGTVSGQVRQVLLYIKSTFYVQSHSSEGTISDNVVVEYCVQITNYKWRLTL